MNKSLDWHVLLLLQRVVFDAWVIGDHERFEREKLPKDRILPRTVPVYARDHVWSI